MHVYVMNVLLPPYVCNERVVATIYLTLTTPLAPPQLFFLFYYAGDGRTSSVSIPPLLGDTPSFGV